MANRLMMIFDSTKDFEKQKQTRANNDQLCRDNAKYFSRAILISLFCDVQRFIIEITLNGNYLNKSYRPPYFI